MNDRTTLDDHELLLRYATGWLTNDQRDLVEKKLAANPELRAELGIINEISDEPSGFPANPTHSNFRSTRKPRWRSVASALIILLVGSGCLWVTQFWSRLKNSDSGSLQHMEAQAIVDGASGLSSSNPFVRNVSFVDRYSSGTPSLDKAFVNVRLRNDFLPCFVEWQVGDSLVKELVPVGDSTFSFPCGSVRLNCAPGQSYQWYQAFTVTCNAERLGTSLGPLLWEVGSADEVTIQICQPIAPWNAAVVWFDSEWIVVTLERPSATYDVNEQLQFLHNGAEQYPNTAWFWARYGSRGLADELAQFFVSKRDDAKMRGRFRGTRHTSISVATFDGLPSKKLRSASLEEWQNVLFDAFERLKTHRPTIGMSIQEEIDLAQKLIEQVEP